MTTLAWKNLFHDKARLAVTQAGIVFALVLVVIHFGLLLGFLETSANVVEHSRADVWIAAPGLPHVNGGAAMPESRRYKALEVPGVARVEKFLLAFSTWKLPRGGRRNWCRLRDSIRMASWAAPGTWCRDRSRPFAKTTQ